MLDSTTSTWRDRLSGLLDLDPTRLGWLGDESARVGRNFLVLLEDGWSETLRLGGRVTGYALGGSLVIGLGAALVAWLAYLLLVGPVLRKGWGSGRFLGCVVLTTIVLCAGFGGGWAGLWLGAGRALEGAIEERYLVERVAVATFLAFTLEEDELPANLDPPAAERLLASAQRRSAQSWSTFRSRAEEAAADGAVRQPGWLRSDLMVAVIEKLGGTGAPDLVALFGVLSSPETATPDTLSQTAPIRHRAVKLLRAAVYPQAATALGFGLVLPLAGVLLVGLAGFLVPRPPKRTDEPSGE